MSQGWQKHLHVSFGQAEYTAGIMHLCKAADYLCKALMVVSPPPPAKKMLVFRMSESASVGYPHLS